MFELSKAHKKTGIASYSEFQEREFALQKHGLRAVKHQGFVGSSYFDTVQNTITTGKSFTTAMKDSTEETQF